MARLLFMLRRLIHAHERYHWRQETRRVTRAFAWGLEHLDPAADGADPRRFLRRHAEEAVAASDEWFAAGAAPWYQLDGGQLSFPSALESPYPENDLVSARWFPARSARRRGGRAGRPAGAGKNGRPRRAAIVLPHWNARPDQHVGICRALQRFGISALRLSLPYHDQRLPAGFERADPMVSPNLGLTIQANRQAVLDVRRALRWLEQQGYQRLGLVGTSIGSSVGFIAMAHEPALRAGVFLHVSTYFGDVVASGLTTSHVWEGLKEQVSFEELRRFWLPISPFPYIDRLRGTDKKMFIISGRYDLAFRYEHSAKLWRALKEREVPHQVLVLPCGHYTLGRFPFAHYAGLRFVPFLLRNL